MTNSQYYDMTECRSTVTVVTKVHCTVYVMQLYMYTFVRIVRIIVNSRMFQLAL